ncbi:hypothetical protein OOT33_14350 [Sphingobium sp. DEHP117]|uniref:SRPBCC family protein n=1 Tax=Sphingobium sp. DEHP117 TaxID=2993436 RepID=UPI0027D6DB4A|nr:SRPBCC family protein [Sphingobium sp. DEHP117]MDQ4421605.1 hypothetical protein [Sphingobium sp. DEHP117]
MVNELPQTYRHHMSETVAVATTPTALFALLDDHDRLATHMMKPSAMMGWSAMNVTFDAGRGREHGSRISMRGRILGLEIEVDEVVTKREPPRLKTWTTRGTPRLWVIGAYRMGFEIKPDRTRSLLTIFIDYELPRWPFRPLGLIAGRFYARWCVRMMAQDAVKAFAI